MVVSIERRHFTVEEYHRMAETGIISDDERVELIEGEIWRMSPIGSRHAACVNRLTKLIERFAGDSAIVSVQNPVLLYDDSEPEPDVALLRPRNDFYAGGHPGAHDVLLIVEVADTSQEKDRKVKVPLYMRAGILEVWLVDLVNSVVEVYMQSANETYEAARIYERGEYVEAETIPGLRLRVDEVLGEQSGPQR
ncbi:MAG: Uma2 family endonuclease [Chloroflexia bacterium]